MSWLEHVVHQIFPSWACPPLCTPYDYFTLNAALIALGAGLMEEHIAAFFRRHWPGDELDDQPIDE